jgi:hypothetical protein
MKKLVFCLWVGMGMLATGCLETEEPEGIDQEGIEGGIEEEGVGEIDAELGVGPGAAAQFLTSCFDAGCTGLNPYWTTCQFDGAVKSSGAIRDQFGNQLGAVALLYSPTCHSIWGFSNFWAPHGNYQLCAVDINDIRQPPQCSNLGSAVDSAATNMQFLKVNESGYASVFVFSPTLGSGSTAAFTRLY